MVIPNPGQLPQNPLVAIIPGVPQPQVQQVNLAPPPPQGIVAPQGHSGGSESVLPQAVSNAPPAPVAQAQTATGAASENVIPQAVVNPAPAPLIYAQQGNAGPSGNVVPVPQADNSDNGEDEIVRPSPDNHPAPGRLLQAY